MSDFSTLLTEGRRAAILNILAQDSDYSVNENIIDAALKSIGHAVGIDRLYADIDWLEEQDLIDVEHVMNMRIVQLTRRGLDVSKGVATCTGVKRPMPGA